MNVVAVRLIIITYLADVQRNKHTLKAYRSSDDKMASTDDADGMEVTDSTVETQSKCLHPFAWPNEMQGSPDSSVDMHTKGEQPGGQPFAWPNEMQDNPGWRAEQLAAEAMASDLSKWIVFDPSESGVEELGNFLQMNSPSVIERSHGVGWISVLGPQYLEERPWELEEEDKVGLQESWDALQQSGRPINFDTVLDLARAHKCVSGKWLFHIDTGIKVDHAWANVAKAVVSGQSGMTAKVSPHAGEDKGRDKHVICVYNRDFMDEDRILEVEDSLRKAGIKCGMTYKPDAFTYMGIYRNNKWQIRPAIYKSDYDLNIGRSKVTPLYPSYLHR